MAKFDTSSVHVSIARLSFFSHLLTASIFESIGLWIAAIFVFGFFGLATGFPGSPHIYDQMPIYVAILFCFLTFPLRVIVQWKHFEDKTVRAIKNSDRSGSLWPRGDTPAIIHQLIALSLTTFMLFRLMGDVNLVNFLLVFTSSVISVSSIHYFLHGRTYEFPPAIRFPQLIAFFIKKKWG